MPHTIKLLLALALLGVPVAAQAEEIVINAVGDIMLAGRGATTYAQQGYGYPFAATAATLKNGDLAIANLEAPITRRGREFTAKRFRFRGSPAIAPALRQAGFTVLTLANNHMLDFGAEGLRETISHLDRHGILHTGAGADLAAARQEALLTVKGKRIAFLAYSLTLPKEFYATGERAGTAPGYAAYYQADIARARAAADYVVVSFHWGEEMATAPKPYQVTAAHRAIDAGADLVLGHHPHVLQGIERYRNGVILYSLGNFAFDSLSPGADRSVIARITLADGVKEVELIPLNVLNREVRFQPQLLAGRRGKAVAEHVERLSRELGTRVVSDGGRYLVNLGVSRPQVARH